MAWKLHLTVTTNSSMKVEQTDWPSLGSNFKVFHNSFNLLCIVREFQRVSFFSTLLDMRRVFRFWFWDRDQGWSARSGFCWVARRWGGYFWESFFLRYSTTTGAAFRFSVDFEDWWDVWSSLPFFFRFHHGDRLVDIYIARVRNYEYVFKSFIPEKDKKTTCRYMSDPLQKFTNSTFPCFHSALGWTATHDVFWNFNQPGLFCDYPQNCTLVSNSEVGFKFNIMLFTLSCDGTTECSFESLTLNDAAFCCFIYYSITF